MKLFSLYILIFLGFLSCREKNKCEAFDLSHPVLDWNMFPELDRCYNFVNEYDTLVFELVSESVSEYEEYPCDNCSTCGRWYKTVYRNEELLQLKFEAYYDFFEPKHSYGSGYFIINNVRHSFSIENGGEINQEEGGPYSEPDAFTLHSSVDLGGETYYDVLEVELALQIVANSDNPMDRFWSIKGEGLVGFELENRLWIRQ